MSLLDPGRVHLDPSHLAEDYSSYQRVVYCAVAFATLAIYEHVLRLDEEIWLIWRGKRVTIVQFLFVISQYFGDAALCYIAIVMVFGSQTDQLHKLCGKLPEFKAKAAYVLVFSMQGIMIYRLSVMYAYRKPIVALLGVSFVLEQVAIILIQQLTTRNIAPAGTFTHYGFCTPGIYNRDRTAFLYAIIAFESLVMVLALVKGIQHVTYYGYNGFSLQQSRRTLTYVLFRDSILFPVGANLACIVNAVTWNKLPVGYGQAVVILALWVARRLGSCLVLNLREAYYRPFEEEIYPTISICFEHEGPGATTDTGGTTAGSVRFPSRLFRGNDRRPEGANFRVRYAS